MTGNSYHLSAGEYMRVSIDGTIASARRSGCGSVWMERLINRLKKFFTFLTFLRYRIWYTDSLFSA